jgi:hypothetical protein
MVLAGSRDRGEADRARAVLLTLAGWRQRAGRRSVRRARRHGSAVAERLHERQRRGAEGCRGAGPGAGEERGGFACGAAHAGGTCRRPAQLDDPPAARRDRNREGVRLSRSQIILGPAQKKFRWRRPRHTLKGRQVAAEVERIGLGLHLRQQQAGAGDIVLLYGDESEALTRPYLAYLARVWAKAGADLSCSRTGTGEEGRDAGFVRSRHASAHRAHQPDQAQQRLRRPSRTTGPFYGPKPGQFTKPVVLVLDNGLIHTSKLSLAASPPVPHGLTVEWLPK